MENKKNGKGLIVLVVVLCIMVIGLGGYICYDKLVLDKKTNDNLTLYKNKYKEVNKELEEEKAINKNELEKAKNPELEKAQMDEAKKLHKTLINMHQYGLYFGEKQTIETVPTNSILPYAIYSYFCDKNLTDDWSHYYMFNTDYQKEDHIVYYISSSADEFELTDAEMEDMDENGEEYPKPVSKKEFDKYFKEKFNTNRVLEIKGKKECNKGKCYGLYDSFRKSPKKNYFSYLYDIESKKFYFAHGVGKGYIITLDNKFLKYETDGNNMYIYDKYLMTFKDESGIISYSDGRGKNLIEIHYDSESQKPKITSDVIKNLNVKEKELNEEYIFKNYDEYLDTYKHTFKKADNGKYYWYSSEIVK